MKSPVDERVYRRVHPVINSVERDARITRGEVNEVRETPGWERIRVQTDSGAIDTVGPTEIAKACEMKDMIMSRRGIGFAVANGSGIKNYGEKKILGHTKDGEGVSLRTQLSDVKKAFDSVHKMNT